MRTAATSRVKMGSRPSSLPGEMGSTYSGCLNSPTQRPDLDSALGRAPVIPSLVTSKFVESFGCAEKEEKSGVGETEIGKSV